MKLKFLSVFAFTLLCAALYAQTITYADMSKGDVARMNFEILGKAADNYLVYKEVKGIHRISVYDYNMSLREDIPITVLPKQNMLLDISFYSSERNYYLLYQYQEDDVVYLKALQIEANGRILNEPVLLDTTMIAYKAENKIYSIASSNDRSKLIVFKINKKDRSLFRFTTLLFDGSLQTIAESRFSVPMEYKGDYLTGHSVANDGSYAFIKYHRQANGNIVDASLIEKPADSDEYREHRLNINDLFLDDIKLMTDDMNGRYLLSSFYSTRKRGDIDGLYVCGIQKNSGNIIFEKTALFNDELKKKATGRSGKNAFNHFFINNIIVHGDGSFTVASEALYNTNNWDRWGFWGGPYWSGGWGGMWGGWGPGWSWGWGRWGGWWPYSYYSPFFYRSYWWGPGWGGPGWGGGSQQFNAGNMAIISFDKEGNKTWDNVIVKSQRENNTDGSISYQVLPYSSSMYFLMNNSGKVSDLENIIINNDGTVTEGQPIKAKDKRIDFMPKYGKRTGAKEIIIPYSYKRNISFARVEL
ncbi:hypothetical protein [Niabella aquatica]